MDGRGRKSGQRVAPAARPRCAAHADVPRAARPRARRRPGASSRPICRPASSGTARSSGSAATTGPRPRSRGHSVARWPSCWRPRASCVSTARIRRSSGRPRRSSCARSSRPPSSTPTWTAGRRSSAPGRARPASPWATAPRSSCWKAPRGATGSSPAKAVSSPVVRASGSPWTSCATSRRRSRPGSRPTCSCARWWRAPCSPPWPTSPGRESFGISCSLRPSTSDWGWRASGRFPAGRGCWSSRRWIACWRSSA